MLDATESVRTLPGMPLSQASWLEFLWNATSRQRSAGNPKFCRGRIVASCIKHRRKRPFHPCVRLMSLCHENPPRRFGLIARDGTPQPLRRTARCNRVEILTTTASLVVAGTPSAARCCPGCGARGRSS